VLISLLLVVAVAYAFFASAGRLTNWPTNTTFLDDQAEGFRAGHLHMAVEPLPELLAKPNPRDGAYRPLWYWDASLHNGHYYLYWGPVPALLLTGFKILFRVSRPIPDQFPTFVLALFQAVAATLLIDRVSRRLFDDVPTGLVALAVLAFCFAAPTPYNLARPAVYESAIIGGHAFALLGLVFAFDAIWRAARGEAVGRWRLPAAGTCWGLALACRLSLAPAIPPLLLLTAWFTVRGQSASDGAGARWRRRAVALAAATLPVVLVIAGLLAYNKARFNGWLEFGRDKQLSWIPFSMAAAFVPYNIYSYLLRPLLLSCTFPFLLAVQNMGPKAFPSWIHVPPGYDIGEPVVGMLTAIPWTWPALIALALGGRSFWRAFRAPGGLAGQGARAIAATWMIASALVLGTLTMLVAMPLFGATMRYLGDVVGSFVLLGTMGAWWLRARLRNRPRAGRALVVAFVGLAVATTVVGVSVGFQGQYPHVRIYNPALMDKLEKRFSVCGH
jgi:hypothetical protein